MSSRSLMRGRESEPFISRSTGASTSSMCLAVTASLWRKTDWRRTAGAAKPSSCGHNVLRPLTSCTHVYGQVNAFNVAWPSSARKDHDPAT